MDIIALLFPFVQQNFYFSVNCCIWYRSCSIIIHLENIGFCKLTINLAFLHLDESYFHHLYCFYALDCTPFGEESTDLLFRR